MVFFFLVNSEGNGDKKGKYCVNYISKNGWLQFLSTGQTKIKVVTIIVDKESIKYIKIYKF